jgi:hypothetical protein
MSGKEKEKEKLSTNKQSAKNFNTLKSFKKY